MPGATRKGLPRCQEALTRRNIKLNKRVLQLCNKPAVAVWYQRAISDEPFYVCLKHDELLNKDEWLDELEIIKEEKKCQKKKK